MCKYSFVETVKSETLSSRNVKYFLVCYKLDITSQCLTNNVEVKRVYC